MAVRKALNKCVDWYRFCQIFRNNLYAFAIEVLQIQPTWQQKLLFESIQISGSRTSVASGHGCFGIDTPIMLYDGRIKPVQDITLDDVLMGDDGTPRNVLDLYRGQEKMYRFTYNDGTSHVFNESHILCVIDWAEGEYTTITVRDFNKKSWNKSRYSCYRHLENCTKRQILNIQSVEPLGIGDYYGFELDGNHQFLGGDFTVLHNTGKTASAGIVALWYLLCFEQSIMMFTAPQINQLKKQVWKEISINLDRIRSNPKYAWLAEYVVFQADLEYIRGENKQLDTENKSKWCVKAKTAPKHSPTNIAGEHGDNYFLWCDEACGIDDEVMNVVMGALTHEDNRAVLTSQPSKGHGFFFDTHHKLSYKVGGDWTSLTFNGELSPIVSQKSIKEQLLKYGSREDPQYKIRVLGEFPERTDEFVITTSMVDNGYVGTAFDKELHQDFGYVIAVDVGGGGGHDDSVIVVAKVWGEQAWGKRARRVEIIDIPLCKNEHDSNAVVGMISECMTTYENAMLVVDNVGVGNDTGKKLKELGYFYKPVSWGSQCFNKDYRKQYFNLRSQAYICMGKALKENRLKIKTNKYRSKILEQLINIPYGFDEHFRYQVMSKNKMKSIGIKSPDVGDCFAFLFLEGVNYAVANRDYGYVGDSELDFGGAVAEPLTVFEGIDDSMFG